MDLKKKKRKTIKTQSMATKGGEKRKLLLKATSYSPMNMQIMISTSMKFKYNELVHK